MFPYGGVVKARAEPGVKAVDEPVDPATVRKSSGSAALGISIAVAVAGLLWAVIFIFYCVLWR